MSSSAAVGSVIGGRLRRGVVISNNVLRLNRMSTVKFVIVAAKYALVCSIGLPVQKAQARRIKVRRAQPIFRDGRHSTSGEITPGPL